MKRVPRSQMVSRALRSASRELKACLKASNALAGKRIAKGDYQAAEELATKGREIQQFQAELKNAQNRWREILRIASVAPRESVTPLWRYYQPILRALVKAGGEGGRVELEEPVVQLMASTLQAADRELMARGRERWRNMIKRARRPLIEEGWLSGSSATKWRITKEGREMAARPDLEARFGSTKE